jgi:hypothetical protein
MMTDFSQYELDELYEMLVELNKEIQDKEGKLRDVQYEQEEYKLEEQREEFRSE